MSTKGSERNIKSKQSYSGSSRQGDSVVEPQKVEPPKPKEEKKVVPIKKVKKAIVEKGNFIKTKQMTFGHDKKLAPSVIQDIDQRMWMKPGAITNYEESSH